MVYPLKWFKKSVYIVYKLTFPRPALYLNVYSFFTTVYKTVYKITKPRPALSLNVYSFSYTLSKTVYKKVESRIVTLLFYFRTIPL